MEYLHETRPRPGPGLLPDTPEERARVRMVTEIITSGIQPHQVTLGKLRGRKRKYFLLLFAVAANLVGAFSIIVKTDGSFAALNNCQNAAQTGDFADQSAREEWARRWITKGFTALEALLARVAGSCCVGDSLTIADCCLVPQV